MFVLYFLGIVNTKAEWIKSVQAGMAVIGKQNLPVVW